MLIHSTFARLSVGVINLPTAARSGSGGALVSYGESMIWMDFEGALRTIDRDGQIRDLDIAPPDNGYDEYEMFSRSPAAFE